MLADTRLDDLWAEQIVVIGHHSREPGDLDGYIIRIVTPSEECLP
jgi:hypothetical protein